MEKLVIVLGDITTHGGEVLTGDVDFTISDRPVASVGDKVHCPLHGDTIIAEGYQTITLQPSRLLAYEGCKTSCGAELIGGKQTICFIEFDDLPIPSVSLPITPPVQAAPHHEAPHKASHKPKAHSKKRQKGEKHPQEPENPGPYPDEDEFKLFVATIWGEACSQSETGIKAVASVIMNRVGFYRWRGDNESVTTILHRTGFDAVHSQLNKEFPKAQAFIFDNEISALNPFEKKKMQKIIEWVKPIYYQKIVTTHANFYYSPKAQKQAYEREKMINPNQPLDGGKHPLIPSFLADKSIKHVPIELAHTDDLKFFYGP